MFLHYQAKLGTVCNVVNAPSLNSSKTGLTSGGNPKTCCKTTTRYQGELDDETGSDEQNEDVLPIEALRPAS